MERRDVGYVYFISGTALTAFVVIGLGVVYAGYQALHGIIGVITTGMMISVVVLSIGLSIRKIKENFSLHKHGAIIILELIMCLIGAALFLYITKLYASDLRSYGDGIWDMISFVVGLLVCGIPWVIAAYGWLFGVMLSKDTGECLGGLICEGVGFGILYALIQWAAS